jgi:hypothetical protein
MEAEIPFEMFAWFHQTIWRQNRDNVTFPAHVELSSILDVQRHTNREKVRIYIYIYIYIFVKLQLGFSPVAVVQQYNRQVTHYTNKAQIKYKNNNK